LHAVYRRDNCLAAVQSTLEDGQMRMSAWFSKVQVYNLPPDEASVYDLDLRSYINVNTPVEFQSAEKLARRIGLDR
jgi:molybdopterin-guanine dinucleotide biosynthesis protein A